MVVAILFQHVLHHALSSMHDVKCNVDIVVYDCINRLLTSDVEKHQLIPLHFGERGGVIAHDNLHVVRAFVVARIPLLHRSPPSSCAHTARAS